jgi:WD40 repeat protein
MLALIEPDLSEPDRLAGVDRLAGAFLTRDGFLAETAGRVIHDAGAERLLLVVDQFEELYADDDPTGTRGRFIDRLLDLSGTGVSVVVTLRADFLGHALDHRPLADALQRGDLKLGPMTHAELAAAVEQPATASGVAIEDGLTGRLLDAVVDEPGNLPLLSFALTRLWGHQEGRVLTHGAYERMGGVETALAAYADEVFDSLGPDDQLRAKAVLLQLVRPGEGTEDTRRLSTRSEIGEDLWRIVPVLAGARLVVTGRDEATGTDTVEIVHEALIRQWGRLRRWMSAERSFRMWQERFRGALRQWEASGWDDGALLRGAPLAEASDWMAQRPDTGSPAERQFLEASQAAAAEQALRAEEARQRELEAARDLAEQHRLRAEAEHARARQQVRSGRLLRLASAALVVLLVVAVATAAAVRNQRNESRRLRLVALTEAMAARVGAELEERLDERALLVARQAWLFDRETGGSRNAVVDRALRQALSVPNFSRILGGYPGGVASVAVSPDARFVATGGIEPRPGPDSEGGAIVTVRDLDDPAAGPVELAGHEGRVPAVAWRPSGGQLATGGSDGTVRLWRPGRDQPELRMERVGSPVTSVVFAPGGAALVAGTEAGSVIAWDVRDPDSDPVAVRVSSGPVASVAAATTPGRFAAGGEDGIVRLVDLAGAAGAVTAEVDAGSPVRTVAFDAEGAAVAAGTDDGGVLVFDAARSGTTLVLRRELTGHRDAVNAVAFAPDGASLASGGDDRSIRVWPLAAEESPTVLSGHTAAVTSLTFADEARPTLFTGSRDRTVRIWELGESGPARTVLDPHDGRVSGLDFSEDGRFLATAGLEDRTVRVHDLAEPGAGPLVLAGHTDEVTGVAFAAGETVVSGSLDGTLRFSARAGDDGQQRVVNAGGPVAALDAHAEEGVVAVATGETVEVYVFEPRTGGAGPGPGDPVVLEHDDEVTAVAVSPDGELVASGDVKGAVRLWDRTRPAEPVGLHLGHTGPVRALAWAPDGARIASGSEDLTVRLVSGERHVVTDAEPDPVQPGGFGTLSGPTGALTAVAFSPDGASLAAASEDGKLRLWDAADTTAVPLALRSHPGGVTAVAFSPDSGLVASGGDSGSVVLEPTRTATLAAYACNRVGRDLTRSEWKDLVGPALPYRPVCSRRTT